MEQLDIISLIENNPITKLDGNYQGKLVTKIKNTFTETEQHLFLTSFYCYLNYDYEKDFVIDLDNIWKWLGFLKKSNAVRLLTQQFIENIDYTSNLNLVLFKEEQKKGSGGHNIKKIYLNIKTFKKFCLKAGTKKADEIHEYFIKLEEILQEIVKEESDELKLQLEQNKLQIEQQKLLSEKEKQDLLEKTLIEQFPVNTQCIYYGKIDNRSLGQAPRLNNEELIKFGQSNNLEERIKTHKKTYTNFRIISAFKVKNKIEIENAIKRHPILEKRMRNIIINDINYRELLALDNENFTIENYNNYFKEIISEHEYNIEKYNLLLERNVKLEDEITKLKNVIDEQNIKLSKYEKKVEENNNNEIIAFNGKQIGAYTYCKFGYLLYAFEYENMRFKCSITRQKDFNMVETNLKNLHPNGIMKYNVKISYPISDKIMTFILKQNSTLLGNISYEASFETIKKCIDITLQLENSLINYSTDLDRLSQLLEQSAKPPNLMPENPEVPIIRKAKRPIDQINKDTGEVINTYDSIEAAGRSLGLTTGTAIGIALREKRVCRGFLWRYSGISKEDQYSEQPVIKVCCSTGEKTYFNTIADAAKDCNISAPGLRQRILTHVHLNNFHWIFNKGATHYN